MQVQPCPTEVAEPATTAVPVDEPPAGPPPARYRVVLTRPDPLYHVVILAICTAVISLAMVLSVRNRTKVIVPVLGAPLPELCMAKRITGMGCPGCGMTRCFISLAHGDVRAAWSYNPAGLWLFAIMAAQIPFRLVQLGRIWARLPEIRTWWLAQILLAALAILMFGQWLLRLWGVAF